MKKFIAIASIVFWSNFLLGNTLEVCPTCTFSTLKKAIELAQPCDTIFVKKGTYEEGNILIDKDLTLVGKNLPILDGNGNSEILTVHNNFFHLEGFLIQNIGTSYTEDRAGVRMKECQNFTLKNNRFLDAFFAIYLEHSKDGVVEGNFVKGHAKDEAGSGNAIHLWYCENISVLGNHVTGHRDGIYLEFVNNSHIAGNLSEGNLRYGLHFMFSNHDFYRKNTFRDNGAGVAVMYSKQIDMLQNVFEKNWGAAAYGLLLKEIHDSKIEQNEFRENTVGIFAETSNRLKINSNHFTQNGWAMKISGGCQEMVVHQNSFVSNSFDLAVQTSGTANNFDGNFWGDYAGYDLDKDGVGDVPYRPMKLFSYVVGRTPEAMVLLRSLFVDILNFSEKVSPVFTPENVVDNRPLMKQNVSIAENSSIQKFNEDQSLTSTSPITPEVNSGQVNH
ncbi:MAG: nitrous oxide reductase family maturation protein NosD [Saprospiraceae bacterium]|nr:nitrous oxide reductase family maturation protein NosD [Saprospiraceae bacterium]